MVVQSRTYNNGTVLEYIYTIVPPKGKSYTQNVFIDVESGEMINPKSRRLILDLNSENIFQGVCCNILDECEGWITEAGACWVTEDGLGWGV